MQPFGQGRHGQPIVPDGIGLVKVSEAQVSVKESFSCEQRPLTRPNLLIEDLQGLQMLFYLGIYRREKKAKQQSSDWERAKTCQGCQGCFR